LVAVVDPVGNVGKA